MFGSSFHAKIQQDFVASTAHSDWVYRTLTEVISMLRPMLHQEFPVHDDSGLPLFIDKSEYRRKLATSIHHTYKSKLSTSGFKGVNPSYIAFDTLITQSFFQLAMESQEKIHRKQSTRAIYKMRVETKCALVVSLLVGTRIPDDGHNLQAILEKILLPYIQGFDEEFLPAAKLEYRKFYRSIGSVDPAERSPFENHLSSLNRLRRRDITRSAEELIGSSNLLTISLQAWLPNEEKDQSLKATLLQQSALLRSSLDSFRESLERIETDEDARLAGQALGKNILDFLSRCQDVDLADTTVRVALGTFCLGVGALFNQPIAGGAMGAYVVGGSFLVKETMKSLGKAVHPGKIGKTDD